MQNYPHWLRRQLYHFYFQPTRDALEVEDFVPDQPTPSIREHIRYLLKLLFYIVTLTVLVNLILWHYRGVSYDWKRGWFIAACAVVFAWATTVAVVVTAIAVGEVRDLMLGAATGTAIGGWMGVVGGINSGTATGAVVGVGFTFLTWAGYFGIIEYPFYVMLAGIMYLIGRWRPHKALLAWRYCPVVWNSWLW